MSEVRRQTSTSESSDRVEGEASDTLNSLHTLSSSCYEGRPEADDVLRALPVWRKLHVRVATLVLVAFFVLTGAVAYIYYWLGYRSDLEFLQQRLKGIVSTLSESVDGDQVHAFAESIRQGGSREIADCVPKWLI